MNEYKNPLKKFWQLGSTSSARVPHFSGTGAPTSTPNVVGLMYIDTLNAKVYVSTGITSATDWKILN